MTSVWLVTSGSYSNYTVELAFSSKELAEAYIAHRRELLTHTDYNEVEEFPLLDHLPEPPEIMYRADVWIEADGTIREQGIDAHERAAWESPELEVADRTLDERYVHAGRRTISVTGADRDEVVRVFRERVAAAIESHPLPRRDQMMATLRQLDESD